jgi:hypothetical protein
MFSRSPFGGASWSVDAKAALAATGFPLASI